MSSVFRAQLRVLLRLLAAVFVVVAAPAVTAAPASAAIEILSRGVDPDPTVPNGTATLTIDVAVDQAPYIVQFDCCSVITPPVTKFIDENQPETQGLKGTHKFEFNVGAGINATDRQITVTVFDSTGAKATQTISFEQPALPPPPAPEPEPEPTGPTALTECPSEVSFALVKAKTNGGCWQKLQAGSQPYTDGNVNIAARAIHYETTSGFKLNGIPFPTPPFGTKYVLAEPSPGFPGGQIGIDKSITIKLGPVTVHNGPLLWKLPSGSLEGRLAAFSLPSGTLGGLPIGGQVEVIFRKRAGRFSTSFPIAVTLPSIFRPSPGTTGSITGSTEIATDETGKVNLDGGKIEIANAAIGKLAIKNLCFSYLSANVSTRFAACEPPSLNGAPAVSCGPPRQNQERFDGALLIGLPTPTRPDLAAYGGIAGGQFAYGGGFIDNAGIPLVAGIALERVGFGLCLQPSVLIKGDAGFSVARGVVRGDVSLTYAETGARSFFVEAAGFLRVAEIPVGDGRVKISSTGAVDFNLNARMFLAGGFIQVRGAVSGFMVPSPFKFNIDGSVSLCIDIFIATPCATGSATVSNLGAGGCADFGFVGKFSGFFFFKKPVRGKQFDFGKGCGFQSRVRISRAIRAQAGSPLDFEVPEDNDQYVAHVTGASAPPKVKVTSPSGKVFESGSGPATSDQQSFLIVESAPDNETSVFLAKDAAPGDWKIEALPGSTLTGLETQAEDKSPSVVAAKVKKQGDRRVVDVRASVKPGEKIALEVIGEDYQQTIATNLKLRSCSGGVKAPGRTSGQSKCASVSFTPTFGYQGKRTVKAIITDENDAAIDSIDAATFTAPSPATPGKVPGVRIVRKGSDVFAIWGPGSKGTTRYGAYVILGDGRKIGHTAPVPCLAWKIPNVRKDTSVKLRVQAGRKDIQFGGAVTVTLKGGADYAGPAKLKRVKVPKACESI